MNRETKIRIRREQVSKALAKAAHKYIKLETSCVGEDKPFLAALVETDCAMTGTILDDAIQCVLFGEQRSLYISRCEFTAACFTCVAAVAEDFSSFLEKRSGSQDTKDFACCTLYDFAVYVLRDTAEILFRSEAGQKEDATNE